MKTNGRYERGVNRAPYIGPFTVGNALDGVQRWAKFSFLLRETGALRCGRLDGLLVPWHWESTLPPGIVGIEVKLSRADFLRGLNSGQFGRYQANVNRLYVATAPDICKTSEIPKGIGHLIVAQRIDYGAVAVCKRHAETTDCHLSPDAYWRIMFDVCQQLQQQQVKKLDHVRGATSRVCKRVHDGIELYVRRLLQEQKREKETP